MNSYLVFIHLRLNYHFFYWTSINWFLRGNKLLLYLRKQLTALLSCVGVILWYLLRLFGLYCINTRVRPWHCSFRSRDSHWKKLIYTHIHNTFCFGNVASNRFGLFIFLLIFFYFEHVCKTSLKWIFRYAILWFLFVFTLYTLYFFIRLALQFHNRTNLSCRFISVKSWKLYFLTSF